MRLGDAGPCGGGLPRRGRPLLPPDPIGNALEHVDEGATLILNGTKTLTFSPLCNYPDGRVPFIAALSVLLDGPKKPRGIVETTWVEIMSFAAVTTELARAYGEGDRTAEWCTE